MVSENIGCDLHEHGGELPLDPADLDSLPLGEAASMFRAMGDPVRLKILAMLRDKELCVTEIAAMLDDNLPSTSQRLKLLRSERLLSSRRQGKHVYYALADQHIGELVANGLAHAMEIFGVPRRLRTQDKQQSS